MRICLTTTKEAWHRVGTGKGKMFARLVPELEKLGIEVTSDSRKPASIDLQSNQWHYRHKKADKKILRLGPAHVDAAKDWRKLNKPKTKSMMSVDGVIYQGEFSQRMCDKYLGTPKCPTARIFNGDDPDYYRGIIPAVTKYKYNFIASTRQWLPQKRLKTIAKAFKSAHMPATGLWIAGNVPKKYEARGIHYLGLLKHKELASYLKMCDCMVHVVYLDVCPNSVVEAICAGCRVLHTDQGGCKEIARGTLIQDAIWDGKPINLNKPPKLDEELLALALKCERDDPTKPFDCEHIDIRNTAKQYAKFFKEVMNA